MKTSYSKIILASAALLLGKPAQSQVSTYLFSQQSTSFTAITGGTVFGNTTSDDQVFVDPSVPLGATSGATGPGMAIGFTFMYNNIPFDKIGINNNGWIFFGQSSVTPCVNSNSSSGYTGISATSTAPGNLQHRVAALSRDLQGQAGSELRIQTIGTSPSQTCVIQWLGYRKFAATGDNYTFQIRLYETSNHIEVVYGSFLNGATAGTAEVGLRGATNTDYNNRSVSTSVTWATSNAGTANNAQVNFNNGGLVPNAGQSYRWFAPLPCTTAPTSNTVVTPVALVCPNGNANLQLAYAYTNTALTYQWLSSTVSPVGPFTPISNATLSTYPATSVSATTWYQVSVTCTTNLQSITTSAQGLTVAATTTNSIPYNEGFEGISLTNQLPNCSWSASSPTTICQTYTIAQANNRLAHNGSKYASFRYGTNSAGDYFYTNGLQLEPGITYSASIWYITDGNPGWSELSIAFGNNQSATGLTAIASQTGAVSGQFYQSLSGLFTVPASGIYYLAIKCIGNSAPQYLTFDDISVTIPCSLNASTVSIQAPPNTICTNANHAFSAIGANSYTWSTGATSSTVNINPQYPGPATLGVTGTNSLTGCPTATTISYFVNQTPQVYIFASSYSVCSGGSATLTAIGANQYLWSNGGLTSQIVVSPAAATIYSVQASSNGCSTSTLANIGLYPSPQIFAGSSNETNLCRGETATLSAIGASSFVWSSGYGIINTNPAFVMPQVSTIYTVTGYSAFGCASTATINQQVLACVSLPENTGNLDIKVSPNPSQDQITISTTLNGYKNIRIMDVTGRVVEELSTEETSPVIDISHLSNGIYYLHLSTQGSDKTIKIIKE